MDLEQYRNLAVNEIIGKLYDETDQTKLILAKKVGIDFELDVKKGTHFQRSKLEYLQRFKLAVAIFNYLENNIISSVNQTDDVEEESLDKIQKQIIQQLYTLQITADKILHQESKQICQQQIQFLRSLLQEIRGRNGN